MADDRHKHPRKTPPAGVAAQIAGPENFDSYTPTHPTPVEQPTIDENVLQRIERRGAETKNSSLDTLQKLGEVHRRIDTTNERLDRVVEVVGDLRETVGETKGQNEVIIGMLEEQRTAKAQSGEIRVVRETMTAEVHGARAKSEIEIEKTEAIATIEKDKAGHAAKVEVVKTVALKVLAGVSALAAAVMAAILAGGNC